MGAEAFTDEQWHNGVASRHREARQVPRGCRGQRGWATRRGGDQCRWGSRWGDGPRRWGRRRAWVGKHAGGASLMGSTRGSGQHRWGRMRGRWPDLRGKRWVRSLVLVREAGEAARAPSVANGGHGHGHGHGPRNLNFALSGAGKGGIPKITKAHRPCKEADFREVIPVD